MLLFALLLWPPSLPASVVQIPWPRPFGLADGLFTDDIRAVAEDATGYLWLASSDGLLRFDGQRFRTLRAEAGLPDLDLRDLHVDARDRIWLATATQGVVVLGVDRSTFERAAADAPAAVRSGHVRQVVSSGEGRIWVIGDDLRVYARAAEHAAWEAHPLGGASAAQLVADRDGTVWAVSPTQLWRWNGRQFAPVPLPGPASSCPLRLWADPRGGVEVSTAQHTWSLDGAGRVQDMRHLARTLLRGRDGVTWQQVGTALQWGRDDQTPGRTMPPLVTTEGETVHVRQVLQDRRGDVWWVGEQGGLWWLPSQWHRFTALPGVRHDGVARRLHPVSALAASGPHHVWVAGTEGVVQRLDLRNGQATHRRVNAALQAAPAPVGMAEDPQGRLWVAGGGQLSRHDPVAGETKQWPLGVAATAPASLQLCADGQVWVAAAGGVQRWSTAGVRLRMASADPLGLSDGVHARQVLCTGRDVWATDPSGLLRWSPLRERFLRVEGDAGGAVTALAAAGEEGLWVARLAAVEQYRILPAGVQRLHHVGSADGYPQVRADALAADA